MATEQIKSIFRDAMKKLGWDEKPVLDKDGIPLDGLKLFSMANESFWLPQLTLKANEVSRFLFKGDCFDVVFKLDKDNASGFSIENPTDAIRMDYGYPMFPSEISDVLTSKIAQYVIKESLENKPNGLMLKNTVGMYDFKDGDLYLRPLEDDALVISMWSDRVPRMSKAYDLVMSPKYSDEMRP